MQVEIRTLSQLFPPTLGTKKGKCVVCAQTTEKGHPVEFSKNFTAWNLLQQGNCVCEYCYTILKNQEYRRKSWVASMQGIRFLNRTEILPVLINPPEPPFAIYITKTGKKQGFLHLINRVNYSKTNYLIAFDDQLIHVNLEQVREMAKIVKEARKLKFSKTELLGDIKVKHFEHYDLCCKILRYVKNPLWEVVVYVSE